MGGTSFLLPLQLRESPKVKSSHVVLPAGLPDVTSA